MKIKFVRHEESVGNLFAKQAAAEKSMTVDTPMRGPDIPLSPEGMEKAAKIKANFGSVTQNDRGFTWTTPIKPKIVCSTYLRAQQTATLSGNPAFSLDERLRDRELGIFDGLTTLGIQKTHPEEFARRAALGKFYHRPPGGESWADVVLRMRSFLFEQKMMGVKNLLVFSHDVPILCAVYICTSLTEDEVLNYQKNTPVANGSVTTLTY